MKKTIVTLAVISAVIFFACKKTDRTCSCTVTKTGTSTTTGKVTQVLFGFPVDLADTSFVQDVNEVTSEDIILQKSTKKNAKNNCYSYSEPYNEKTTMAVPASSFNLSVEVVDKGTKKHDCKLK